LVKALGGYLACSLLPFSKVIIFDLRDFTFYSENPVNSENFGSDKKGKIFTILPPSGGLYFSFYCDASAK